MLKAIKLFDFKCFSEEHFKLASLTVFTGTNSVGKSSVLQASLLVSHRMLAKGI